MKERIQKVLGNAGIASRRNIEDMVREGRVAVNGKVMKRLPVLIDPEDDRIEIDGERVRLPGARGSRSSFGRYSNAMSRPIATPHQELPLPGQEPFGALLSTVGSPPRRNTSMPVPASTSRI